MKKRPDAGRIIRYAIIAAAALAGAAAFAAAAWTKLLPASYLAALAAALTLPLLAAAFLALGRSRARRCAGAVLAAVYISFTVSGCSLAAQTRQTVEKATVTSSPLWESEVQTLSAESEPEPTLEPTPVPSPEPTPESKFPRAFTIYVSGIDSRHGLVDESFSDVNIVVTVNRDTHQVLLLTMPRDSFVPIPYLDGVEDKLTRSGQYGIEPLVGTVEAMLDIDADYWFRLDFIGFANIIDALGGITVEVDEAFTAFDGTEFTQGENVLNGKQALSFARERKSFPGGDYQRGRNHLYLIQLMMDKILTPDMLNTYSDILDSLEGSFETSIPYDLLAELVRTQLAEDIQWDVVTYQLKGESDYVVLNTEPELGEQYIIRLDNDTVQTAHSLISSVLSGETVTQP